MKLNPTALRGSGGSGGARHCDDRAVSLMSRRAFADITSTEAIATISRFSTSCSRQCKSWPRHFRPALSEAGSCSGSGVGLTGGPEVSVGPGWVSRAADQRSRLLERFRLVASYVVNFDSYSGQSFTVRQMCSALVSTAGSCIERGRTPRAQERVEWQWGGRANVGLAEPQPAFERRTATWLIDPAPLAAPHSQVGLHRR
jgi:hypothetical protein